MRSQNRWRGIVLGVLIGGLLSASVVLAGSLEPSGGPTAADSQMYNLEQIYNRINNGAAATKKSTFTEPSNGPTAGTMHTLDELYNLVGLRAPVPRTGQNILAPIFPAPAGSDGRLSRGVDWPNPRFTDNDNGTVTDNLTGLIWLKNANCFGLRTWFQALIDANTLAGGYCGLTDASTVGQWRLPNVREMQSLINYRFFDPALSNTNGSGKWTTGDPFTGVQSAYYWSSTTYADITDNAWHVYLRYGFVNRGIKTDPLYVWPVRGGQ